jgi:hypothetical protein
MVLLPALRARTDRAGEKEIEEEELEFVAYLDLS